MNDLNAKPVSRTAKKAGPKKATTRAHSKLGNVNVPGGGDTVEADANITWAYTKQVKEDGEVANPMGFDDPVEEGKVAEAPQRTKSDTKHIENDSKFDYDDYPEIKIHGWMYKESKKDFRLMAAANWRKRYFVLYTPKEPYDKKNSMLMYFDDEIACQKYFKNTNMGYFMSAGGDEATTEVKKKTGTKSKQKQGVDDLLLGHIDLAALTYFQESYRLDLNHRAMELKTQRRTWVLQVDGVADFYNWFNAIWRALVTCNNRSVKMNLPNVWNYRMPGKLSYRITFILFVCSGFWWIYNLLVAGSPDLQPCVEDTLFLRKAYTCQEINAYGASIGYKYDIKKCITKRISDFWWAGTWNPFIPQGEEQWKCFVNVDRYWPSKPPMYWLFVIAECLNLIFASMFYLGLWRPTRRGARFLDSLNPPFPEKFWPSVDVLICHYSEPADDTMQTVDAALDLEYPKDKLHIWVCDDGYCKSTFKESVPWPSVKVNASLIAETGDTREQLAELIRERCGMGDEMEARLWRKKHASTLRVQDETQKGGQVVHRNDCAVGIVRDDYNYSDPDIAGKIASVHFIARMKTKDHHAKAGNINNCLYNAGAEGRYLIILDNDMQPHPKFLKATLPLFYCKPGRLGGSVFDDNFTTTNMDESDIAELDDKPLDMPINLPTVSPAYGADLGKDKGDKDLLTLDEQIKLRETCRNQAQEIRKLKQENEKNKLLGSYQPYKRGTKKREKKIFEASAPMDLDGARISTVSNTEDFDEGLTEADNDGDWM
eukprot:CAMPEP_0182577108 /NCGR_PEP_ID=MMETSP1324-20130603/36238_1 /TAXON_ID=236786 /ORGANISM="Florenciella sp., Strain RCC1587" /LENGTH=768 /DNA_ID=CAMNT_0024792879 /DNA_START=4 /DNA_END=2310 /DNA_ORIENTATION=-